MRNTEYWDTFYKDNGLTEEPSSFAKYVFLNYLTEGEKLLELGCGNGRDAIFFVQNKLNVTALDLSKETINKLNKIGLKDTKFIHQDFSDLSGFTGFSCIYSRFTLHAVSESVEKAVFSQLSSVLLDGGKLLIEARTKKDETLSKNFGFTHYRRFLDYEETLAKVEETGFRIIAQEERQGLSPFGKEDPFLLRIIAEKI